MSASAAISGVRLNLAVSAKAMEDASEEVEYAGKEGKRRNTGDKHVR